MFSGRPYGDRFSADVRASRGTLDVDIAGRYCDPSSSSALLLQILRPHREEEEQGRHEFRVSDAEIDQIYKYPFEMRDICCTVS